MRPAEEAEEEVRPEEEADEEAEEDAEEDDEPEVRTPAHVPGEIVAAVDRMPVGTTRMVQVAADGSTRTIIIIIVESPAIDFRPLIECRSRAL